MIRPAPDGVIVFIREQLEFGPQVLIKDYSKRIDGRDLIIDQIIIGSGEIVRVQDREPFFEVGLRQVVPVQVRPRAVVSLKNDDRLSFAT